MSSKGQQERLHLIGQTLFDKKGFNIFAIDVRGVSTLADYFIIAEGSSDKHAKALADSIVMTLKERDERPCHVEGLAEGDWVVLDYMDLVIHLFKPGMRDKYRLEELWHEGQIVDLNIVLSNERGCC
ncbi:MAG: ribosome silencing factor [Chlamydiia bacterium]|nr:ribosome silencing factor [Chlamydiia bacterium]